MVPGFGLFRAGAWRRGAAWLFGLQLVLFLAGCAAAPACVPLGVGLAALAFAQALQIAMWCDSLRPGRMTWRLWGLFLVLFGLRLLLPSPFNVAANPFKTPAGSMEPTLMGSKSGHTPDYMIVDRLSYRLTKPVRGDLVVFDSSAIPALSGKNPGAGEKTYFVKRLVGLPGERIQIRDGALLANGRRLGPADGIPPIRYVPIPPHHPSSALKEGDAFVVGRESYFVLGDNVTNSYDSRYWGCVPEASLFGRVSKIYYPFTRMGAPAFVPADGARAAASR
jgi:signal peptidase I